MIGKISSDSVVEFKTTISWQCMFNSETINASNFLTRFPEKEFFAIDKNGYGMPFAGNIFFISFDFAGDNNSGYVTYFTNNNISFNKGDFLNLFYNNLDNKHTLQLLKNGEKVGLDMACIPSENTITTFTIGLSYNII